MKHNRAKLLSISFSCIGILLSLSVREARAQAVTSIKPGVQWYDTDGNELNALGGLVVHHDGVYYWVGTDFANSATNLYSSTDLMNWTFRKAVLTRDTHADLREASWNARPSIFYSSVNDRWVIYTEWQTSDMPTGDNDLGWATSPTIDGDYTWQGHYTLDGYPFHDASLYSEDGTNYFITSNWDGGGTDCAIWEIGADDRPGTLITAFNIPGEIEGTHLFKRNGYYYWIGSEKEGWRGSPSKYIRATSMEGLQSNSGFTPLSCTGPNSDSGFHGQCDFVLQIPGTDEYILCKDVWSYFHSEYGNADQVWLPLQWNGDTPSVTWVDEWTPSLGGTGGTGDGGDGGVAGFAGGSGDGGDGGGSSGGSGGNDGTGASVSVGGADSTGGTATGGIAGVSVGGTGGVTGGGTSAGGTISTGGTTAGGISVGGTISTGGATGGGTSVGGTISTGGSTAGGSSAGGAIGTGGSTADGSGGSGGGVVGSGAAAPATGATASSGDATGDSQMDTGGCSCTTRGQGAPGGALLFLAVALALPPLRRKRR